MSTPSLPRRKPRASGRILAIQPAPGAPYRALPDRPASGWERFMRRADLEGGDRVPPRP